MPNTNMCASKEKYLGAQVRASFNHRYSVNVFNLQAVSYLKRDDGTQKCSNPYLRIFGEIFQCDSDKPHGLCPAMATASVLRCNSCLAI